MDGSSLRQSARASTTFLGSALDLDWDRPIPEMTWSVREVVAHISEVLLRYATDLSAGARELSTIDLAVRPAEDPAELLATITAVSWMLGHVVDGVAPGHRGWHPAGLADAAGFAAMGCDEILVHTADAATGLGLEFEPPVVLSQGVLRRLFPGAPRDTDTWDTLLWANGRRELLDRPRQVRWHPHPAPLSEWVGADADTDAHAGDGSGRAVPRVGRLATDPTPAIDTREAATMTAVDPAGRLAQAIDATGELITGVRADQWADPTPCPEWTVRSLVNHLVFGMRRYVGILSGQPPLPADDVPRLRAVDQLGDDPAGAYRAAGAGLLAVAGRPGIGERSFAIPIGTVPGAVALHILTTEVLVHGWDVARATGQPARLPESVAELELAFTRRQLPPDVPRTNPSFGPAQQISDDAAAIDRLAAYLGRPVTPAGPASSR